MGSEMCIRDRKMVLELSEIEQAPNGDSELDLSNVTKVISDEHLIPQKSAD